MAYAKTLTARARPSVVLVTILALVGLVWATQGADAGPQPADKVSVAASGVDVTPVKTIAPTATPVEDELTLLATDMRVSSPSDLILSVTAECALWTNTSTVGNDDQESIARVEVWVEIDGTIVPVSETNDPSGNQTAIDPDERADRGRVVFCNRAQRMKTENFDEGNDDGDNIIRLFNRTRSANAFNWVAVNAGRAPYDKDNDNILHIEVKARLAAQVFCEPDDETPAGCASASVSENVLGEPVENPAARAGVGKRTLVIEPTKLVNNATT